LHADFKPLDRDRAVSRMPELDRGRYREEWYANNEDWRGGKVGKLWHAFGCYFSTRALNEIAEKKINQKLSNFQKDEARHLEHVAQLLEALRQQQEQRHRQKIYTTNFDALIAKVIQRDNANNESTVEALSDELSKVLNRSKDHS
jgi:hypothetical protein